MLRQNQTLFYWKAIKQLRPSMNALKGRAREEPKFGTKTLLRDLVAQSNHRNQKMKPWERSIARAGINAVALENGSDWPTLSKDLARQNIAVTPRSLHRIAQFEPLAFRCMIELSSSAIPPPPNTTDLEAVKNRNSNLIGDSADEQLRNDIARLLRPKSVLKGSGNQGRQGVDEFVREEKKVVSEWEDAWQEFDVVADKKK